MSDNLIKLLDQAEGEWRVFPQRIPEAEDKPLAIMTAIGDFGTGKSFSSNILLNFLLKASGLFKLLCGFKAVNHLFSRKKSQNCIMISTERLDEKTCNLHNNKI